MQANQIVSSIKDSVTGIELSTTFQSKVQYLLNLRLEELETDHPCLKGLIKYLQHSLLDYQKVLIQPLQEASKDDLVRLILDGVYSRDDRKHPEIKLYTAEHYIAQTTISVMKVYQDTTEVITNLRESDQTLLNNVWGLFNKYDRRTKRADAPCNTQQMSKLFFRYNQHIDGIDLAENRTLSAVSREVSNFRKSYYLHLEAPFTTLPYSCMELISNSDKKMQEKIYKMVLASDVEDLFKDIKGSYKPGHRSGGPQLVRLLSEKLATISKITNNPNNTAANCDLVIIDNQGDKVLIDGKIWNKAVTDYKKNLASQLKQALIENWNEDYKILMSKGVVSKSDTSELMQSVINKLDAKLIIPPSIIKSLNSNRNDALEIEPVPGFESKIEFVKSANRVEYLAEAFFNKLSSLANYDQNNHMTNLEEIELLRSQASKLIEFSDFYQLLEAAKDIEQFHFLRNAIHEAKFLDIFKNLKSCFSILTIEEIAQLGLALQSKLGESPKLANSLNLACETEQVDWSGGASRILEMNIAHWKFNEIESEFEECSFSTCLEAIDHRNQSSEIVTQLYFESELDKLDSENPVKLHLHAYELVDEKVKNLTDIHNNFVAKAFLKLISYAKKLAGKQMEVD